MYHKTIIRDNHPCKDLRHDGSTVSVLPMNKNLGYQIKMLEESGYTSIEKVYRDK